MKLTPELKDIALCKAKEHGLIGNPEMFLDFVSDFLDVLPNSEPVAYITYKGHLLHANDPKVSEHSNPEPLYAADILSAAKPLRERIVNLEAEVVRLKALCSEMDGQLGKRPCQNERCVTHNGLAKELGILKVSLKNTYADLVGVAEGMRTRVINNPNGVKTSTLEMFAKKIDSVINNLKYE